MFNAAASETRLGFSNPADTPKITKGVRLEAPETSCHLVSAIFHSGTPLLQLPCPLVPSLSLPEVVFPASLRSDWGKCDLFITADTVPVFTRHTHTHTPGQLEVAPWEKPLKVLCVCEGGRVLGALGVLC